MTSAPIPVEAVAELYQDPTITRVGLRWEKLTDAGVTGEIRTRRGKVPGEWYTPWHVDDTGRPCRYDHPKARPVTVAECIPYLQLDTAHHAERNARIATGTGDSTPQILVLTWGLPDGTTILLDGNHRAATTHHADQDAIIVEMRLNGTADPELLPDLIHHQRSRVPAQTARG